MGHGGSRKAALILMKHSRFDRTPHYAECAHKIIPNRRFRQNLQLFFPYRTYWILVSLDFLRPEVFWVSAKKSSRQCRNMIYGRCLLPSIYQSPLLSVCRCVVFLATRLYNQCVAKHNISINSVTELCCTQNVADRSGPTVCGAGPGISLPSEMLVILERSGFAPNRPKVHSGLNAIFHHQKLPSWRGVDTGLFSWSFTPKNQNCFFIFFKK